ncbi:hypothetical protein [Pedobacter sp. BMA]|uniref:hypothetical protein n=1 Tax=Pedobacter sp. BMA TaxID=1663685 RepID=UPI00064A6E73|nr:hypothetical protein [Pedobacter sp. BMA]KLT63979.1 hypothetical protein AB669_19870 [Pedobacter sp. BMA]
MNSNDLETELRKQVCVKYGMQKLDAQDCLHVSEQIFRETKNYVSQTNLKRFFKLDQPEHQNSQFVLNSLAQFLGFVDIKDFSSSLVSPDEDVN